MLKKISFLIRTTTREEICIQLYTDPETKRRIELRATKYDVAIAEYCLTAIQRQ